jgi:glutathione peroxidase
MNTLSSLTVFAAVAGCLAMAFAPHSTPVPGEKTIYDFKMENIDGKSMSLAKFKGKVLLVVNVASRCGYTPQYKGLEALYKERKTKGLVVLGFPANNFGAQEPGSNQEIKEFCTSKFDVTFPMFSKISVKGDDEHPLYKWLIANSDRQDDIEWNFTKFVIGKDGKVFKRFRSSDAPDSKAVLDAIDEALAE